MAKWSSICPLCSKFIAKNLSRVVRLPHAIFPRCTPDGRRSLDDGDYYYALGDAIGGGRKSWAHHYCWSKFDRQPRYEALQIVENCDFYRLIDRRDDNFHYLYRFFDVSRRLLYVGITYDVAQRLDQHYYARPLDEIRRIHAVTTQKFANRQEVIDAEHEAIATEKPLWNIAR